MNKHEKILQRANELKQEVIDLRRDFHQHPEVSLYTFNTAGKVAQFLKKLGIETKMLVNGAGVRGFLKGAKPGKTFALRADLDALPLQEETDLSYRSINPGVMHGCGHDAHTAMLLGAAKILAEWKGDLSGNVAFIFQPAEETGDGAKKMIEEGAIEGVDGIFGLHVMSSFDAGTLGYRAGPLMAAGDFFDVKIKGKGGHAGLPHEAIDPVVIAAIAIINLQAIVSREIDPLESAVISICKMEAGKGAYNVIPDVAAFGGTIRTHNLELREYISRRIKEILDGIVPGMRGSYEFNLMNIFPPTINDEKMTSFVAKVAGEVLGEKKVFEMNPLMGSEDFSYYLQKVPGSFVYFGMKKKEKGIAYPHHHPRFDIDEEMLPIGTALNVAVALEYLQAKEG
jgi:amidohydrolase